MKSIVEQHNASRRRKVTVNDARMVPVVGRLCRSSLKRLAHAYRDLRPAAMLVSHSRFAPGYVVDSFLATIDEHASVIRITRSFDEPAAFMDAVLRGAGFESRATSLAQLDHAFGLFLRYQRTHHRRTVVVVRDIDAHGVKVRACIRELIDKEAANEFGLMVILTGPANDSPEAQDPILDSALARYGDRIVLTPFAMAETREFVRDRFAHAGSNGQPNNDVGPKFEFYAVGFIHELSSGVPETVDLLCRKSIENAARKGEMTISTTTVKAAAQLLGLIPSVPADEPEPPVPAPDATDDPAGQLIVKVEGETERTIHLNGGNLLIGRDRLCDICVGDAQVSRLHGLFARSADGMHYVDLGSTNGSTVNGESTRGMVLENNDVIAVGDVRIIYSENTTDATKGVDLDATDIFEILEQDKVSSINYVGKGVIHRFES